VDAEYSEKLDATLAQRQWLNFWRKALKLNNDSSNFVSQLKPVKSPSIDDVPNALLELEDLLQRLQTSSDPVAQQIGKDGLALLCPSIEAIADATLKMCELGIA
jgi:hypothetical protein